MPVPPPLDSTFAFVFTHEVQTITVQLSWRGPTLEREPDDVRDGATVPDLLNADESPFQRALVDAGLFQSATMSADLNRHGSSLHFTGTTTLDQLTNALGTLGNVLGQLGVEGYFDTEMLKADAKRDRVSMALAFEDSPSLASSLGSSWAVRRLGNYTRRDSVVQSTPESLRAFAARWIVNQPYIIGVLTPEGTEQAVGRTVSQYVAFMKQQ